MFWSAVTRTSKPACSAWASRSPLVSVSHPRSLAFVMVWPGRKRATPRGVTWSKRTSIRWRLWHRGGHRIKTARGKFQHRVDLFSREVELFDDFLDGSSGLEILEHRRDGHASITKYPCAVEPAGNTFHCGAS